MKSESVTVTQKDHKDRPTPDEFRKFHEDQPGFYRQMANQARDACVRKNLLDIAQSLEEAAQQLQTSGNSDNGQHDRALLNKITFLRAGGKPSIFKKIVWKIDPAFAKVRLFLSKFLSWTIFILSWTLRGSAYALTTGGGVYFLVYSSYFGLGVQLVLGFVIFLLLNILLYTQRDKLLENTHYPKRTEFNCWLYGIMMISTIILICFTCVVSITPSWANGSPSSNPQVNEVVGIIQNYRTGEILSIVYPNGSPSASDGGNFWMKAPRPFRDKARWFSLIDRDLSYVYDTDRQENKCTFSLSYKLKAKPGDVLKDFKSEEDYLIEAKSKIPQIIKESFKDGKFDPVINEKLIAERLSNGVFSVSLGSKGVEVVETIKTVYPLRIEAEAKK